MAQPRRKVVWILGSGFSKSLGGPLLKDLLSHRRRELVDATFSSQDFPKFPPKARRVAYEVFDHYRETSQKAGYWADAEEFLDFVDVACIDGSSKGPVLEQLTSERSASTTIHQLREWAILSVASECSTYTEGADLENEAWGPYLHWKANLVREPDAIITFNYDLVLEQMTSHPGCFGYQTVVTPNEDRAFMAGVPILKLHGSVNWAQKGDADESFQVVSGLRDFAAAQMVGSAPLIAAPGATKKRLCTGSFANIWTAATKHLVEADVIVFIGFRFPPSDSHARSVILGAIANNTAPYLRVHTVLGPNLNEPDTVRLTNLLHHAIRRSGKLNNTRSDRPPTVESAREKNMYGLFPQPLYAEDFLSVADDTEIFGGSPQLIYRDKSTPPIGVDHGGRS